MEPNIGVSKGRREPTNKISPTKASPRITNTRVVSQFSEVSDSEASGDHPTCATDHTDESLGKILHGDRSITKLEIDIERIENWAERMDLEEVMKDIGKLSSVQALTLNFKSVRLGSYPIILESVRNSDSVLELKLLQAKLDEETANHTSVALAENRNSIQKISISGCKFVNSGFSVMFLGLQHVLYLNHLSINSSTMDVVSCHVLGASLPLLYRLETLYLINVKLPLEGLKYILNNVTRCKTLSELSLSGNDLDATAVASLADLLSDEECNIDTLLLADCDLDPSAIDILCRGLTHNKKLKSLTLKGNEFGNLGAFSLVTLLRTNHTIQHLNIEGCCVSSKNLAQLRDGLRYNNSFLKNVFSTEVSLAILDSVGLVGSLKG
eukprot:Nitzschia sp. Nitz4//scaffold161_size51353//22709//23854//NITZ4_006947-RA/size51353-processed-gene-0.72-mRNA-1//-1//CDS//3329537906//7999//frame0